LQGNLWLSFTRIIPRIIEISPPKITDNHMSGEFIILAAGLAIVRIAAPIIIDETATAVCVVEILSFGWFIIAFTLSFVLILILLPSFIF